MRSCRARSFRVGVGVVLALVLCPVALRSAAQPSGGAHAGDDKSTPTVIKAARLIDGRGRMLTNSVVTVQGSKITYVGHATSSTPPPTFNLGDVTLMPGMIDVHVHIDWHFQPNGLYGQRSGQSPETPERTTAAIQKNLDAMLQAGFTTVQSLGSDGDRT